MHRGEVFALLKAIVPNGKDGVGHFVGGLAMAIGIVYQFCLAFVQQHTIYGGKVGTFRIDREGGEGFAETKGEVFNFCDRFWNMNGDGGITVRKCLLGNIADRIWYDNFCQRGIEKCMQDPIFNFKSGFWGGLWFDGGKLFFCFDLYQSGFIIVHLYAPILGAHSPGFFFT